LKAENFGVLLYPIGDHLDVHLNVPELESVGEFVIFRVIDQKLNRRHFFEPFSLETLPEDLSLYPLDLIVKNFFIFGYFFLGHFLERERKITSVDSELKHC
jgi:hypothetical protein